jgi:hypothetical protein
LPSLAEIAALSLVAYYDQTDTVSLVEVDRIFPPNATAAHHVKVAPGRLTGRGCGVRRDRVGRLRVSVFRGMAQAHSGAADPGAGSPRQPDQPGQAVSTYQHKPAKIAKAFGSSAVRCAPAEHMIYSFSPAQAESLRTLTLRVAPRVCAVGVLSNAAAASVR